MKKCHNCQAEISDTAKFCPECGSKVEAENVFSDNWLADLSDIAEKEVENKMANATRARSEKALAAFEFEEHMDGTYTVTGLLDKYALNITIPVGVVAIGNNAFEGCEAITVTLPEGLLKIGSSAFKGSQDLSSINLPKSIFSIGDEAFMDCGMLDIEIPASVRKVGRDAIKNTVADLRKVAEEKRIAEEARREKERRDASAARKAKEAEAIRKAEAAKKAKEKRKAEEAKRVEAARLIEKARKAEAEKAAIDASWSIGTVHGFGNSQTCDASGIIPIKWRVIDRSGDWALVITEESIEYQPYNNTEEEVTWETCSLRKWLNEDFYNRAFSPSEQNLIGVGTQYADSNSVNQLSGGNNTQDKVFILNISEAEGYFKTEDERKAVPSARAKSLAEIERKRQGNFVFPEDYGWWLRTPGATYRTAAQFTTYGMTWSCGVGVNRYGYVRPVIWVAIH
jgi:RNA polymerase subunit RPABC4/transcription elongation factor Spt4